jgi:hypothetical protein
MTLAQESAQWLVLVEAGFASAGEVVNWADRWITRDGEPHPRLIEIATLAPGAFNELVHELRALAAGVDRFEALRCAVPGLRRLIERGAFTPAAVAAFTYRYLCGDDARIPAELRSLYSADDEFELAASGQYGDLAEVTARFLAALRAVEVG